MEDANDFDVIEDSPEESSSVYAEDTQELQSTPQSGGIKSKDNIRVDIVDKEMTIVSDLLSDKFPQDYCILVRFGDYTRQDLITAVVERLKAMVEGADKGKLNAFIGWLCRTLNLDPGVFNDLAVLNKELSLAQQNIESIFEGIPQEVVFEEELTETMNEE